MLQNEKGFSQQQEGSSIMKITEIKNILDANRPNVNKFLKIDYIETCQEVNKIMKLKFFEGMTKKELLISFDEFCRDEYMVKI